MITLILTDRRGSPDIVIDWEGNQLPAIGHTIVRKSKGDLEFRGKVLEGRELYKVTSVSHYVDDHTVTVSADFTAII